MTLHSCRVHRGIACKPVLRRSRLHAAIAASLLLVVRLSGQSSGKPPYDAILHHATIVDGTGLKPYAADLAIQGGYIARIGDLSGQRGVIDLDATGLYVAPGFLNIHSHAEPPALPTAENMLLQGVTTEILNADGSGDTDIDAQLSRLAAAGLAVNVGADIGFNAVWTKTMGNTDRRPSEAEIEQMRGTILRNLEHGAWGVSAGLDYKPAYFARTDEVIRVVSVAAPWRTNFPNHDRITPESNYSSMAGMNETLEIGRQAGIVPVITHMKVQGREQGSAPEILERMRQSTQQGHYAAADVYPYLAGLTSLSALLVPGWAQEGGRPQMLVRFNDPALRARIVREVEEAMKARFNGPTGVYLAGSKEELQAVMQKLGAPAGEAVVRTASEGEQMVILRFGREDDLVRILQHPTSAVACDCGATIRTPAHPRYFGTFPRVLGHYVRETGALTWEDAVRKMSGLPASTIGMSDRGFLAPGMRADIAVFDPRTVIDHATYENTSLPPEGIRYVFVNGQLAVRDGKVTGAHAGRALYRSPHMPSRPMNAAVERRISLSAKMSGQDSKVRVRLNVTQAPGATHAEGSFLLDDGAGNSIGTTAIGILQTGARWASFTGRARISPKGEERAIALTLDLADPALAGAPAANGTGRLIVDAEDAFHFAGSFDARRARLAPAAGK